MNNTSIKDHFSDSTGQSFKEIWNSKGMVSIRLSIYIPVILVAFFGNLLLLLMISLTKKMRNVTNYFLLNMAVGDLMVSVFCMPLEVINWFYYVSGQPIVCKTMPFFQATSIGVSVYTLIVMAVDRYLAIMSPLGVHFSPKQSAIIVACIWVAAAATASPALFVMQVRSIKEENGTTLRCDEYGWNERNASIYTLTLLAVYYCIPLLVMVIIYSRISIFLWFRKIPGAEELSLPVRQKLYSKKMKRKRTIRLLITVVTAFLICHLPQNIMSMIWYVFKHSFRPPYYMTAIAFFSEFMLHSNSSLNPILYAFLHKKFKESARILFKAVFRGQPMRETSLVQTKSRTTTLISLRTRSSCQNSAKALLSPVRRERMSQTSKLVSPSTRLLMETQNL